MLDRSQNAPLDVALSGDEFRGAVSTRTLTIIFREIKRIRSFNVDFMPPNFLDTVHDILASFGRDWEATLLESLSIKTMSSSGPRPVSIKMITDVFRPTHLLHGLTQIGRAHV